jgi:hypothetical protein
LNESTIQAGLEAFFPNPKLRSIVVPLFTAKLYVNERGNGREGKRERGGRGKGGRREGER